MVELLQDDGRQIVGPHVLEGAAPLADWRPNGLQEERVPCHSDSHDGGAT